MKESEIQRAILDYLAARHVMAFRMNTGAVVSEYKGKKRFMRFGTPGCADILAFPHFSQRTICSEFEGTWHVAEIVIPTWIEVKTTKGKQSDLQRSFQAQVEGEHHRYGICRSIEDVEELLR